MRKKEKKEWPCTMYYVHVSFRLADFLITLSIMRIRWAKMRGHVRSTMMTRMVMMVTQTVVRSCGYIRVQIIHRTRTAPIAARTGPEEGGAGGGGRQWGRSRRVHKRVQVVGVVAVVLRGAQATWGYRDSTRWTMVVMVVVMVSAAHCRTRVHAKQICRLVCPLVHGSVCWCRLGRLSKSLDSRR